MGGVTVLEAGLAEQPQGVLGGRMVEVNRATATATMHRKYPLLPQRLAGRDLFWWLTRLRLMRVPATSRLGRRGQARGEFVIVTNRRRLARAGVRFRPRVVGAQGRTVRFADGGELEVGAVVWATGYRADQPDLLAKLAG